MPTYEELVAETAPARIDNYEDYRAVHTRFLELFGRRNKKTAAEAKLMALLGVLIQDYDRRHGLPPDDSTPAERLRFLLDTSGRTAADLLPVFGQRSHVHEALNGKRAIGVDHARKLGELFGMRPGFFI